MRKQNKEDTSKKHIQNKEITTNKFTNNIYFKETNNLKKKET